jgi:exonuclease V gamma subunit
MYPQYSINMIIKNKEKTYKELTQLNYISNWRLLFKETEQTFLKKNTNAKLVIITKYQGNIS